MMKLLTSDDGQLSEILRTHSKDKVQDAYSLRAIPQIHGAAYDLIQFVTKIINVEMNSANDNPLVINSDVLSGGNFHGCYVAMAADQLAYAFSLLCNISERRLERMVNHSLNGFMPSFLTNNPGLNSGFMIVQYATAGITAENRHLSNPGSLDSIPTCEGSEDIVSMAGWSSRKAYQAMENTYQVLAYELFVSMQALDFTKEQPNKAVNSLYNHIRTFVPFIENDMYMKPYIDKVLEFLYTDKIFELTDC